MQETYKISACIVSYNEAKKLYNAVSSIIENTKNDNFCIYVSDNGSADNCVDAVKALPKVKIIENKANLGFGKAHNKVIPYLDSKYHAVINPDIVLSSDAITKMCDYMEEHPDVLMVTPKILNSDGTQQHLPKRKPKLKYLLGGRIKSLEKWRREYTREDEALTKPTEVEFCTGCFFVINTDLFKKLGGFDERYFMYFEDADLSLQVLKHGKIVFLPDVSVTHLWERQSSKNLKYFLIHSKSALKFFIKNIGK